jgi:3-deoxy-D-manno-octulosonate 8-phosphate phosphatase (KDO 8-P phosphatase)
MNAKTAHTAQAKQTFTLEVLARACTVKVIFFDIDGVLTDGGLYFDAQGESLKRFHTLDGLGIKLLQQAGIDVVVLTGRDSAPLRLRLAALGVRHARYGLDDKLPAAQELLQLLGLTWAQAAAVGDDWPDLAVLTRCALACAPPASHPEVLARVHHVTRAAGGQGAARECCDLLLQAGGHYDAALAHALQ